MRKLLALMLCCAPLLAVLTPAQADVLGKLRINGFGQVVVGSTLDNNRPYPQFNYDADPKFDQESLFALQVTAPLTEKLSATAQIVSHGNDDFKTKFEWAYVNYQFNNDWSVKVGRQRAPLFYFSDYLEVGVAYPWLRTPTSVYSSVSNFSNIDGASLLYSHTFGSWELDPQLTYGRYTGTIGIASTTANIDDRNFASLSVRGVYNDWLTLRAGYSQSQLSITNTPVDPIIAGLQSAGLNTAAKDVAIDGDTVTFMELGAEVDYAKWQMISEYIQLRSFHNYIANSHDYYVAVGRHFGKFMPMVTYGRRNNATSSQVLGEIPNVPPLAPLAAGVASVIASQAAHDDFYQFDLRYDLADNVALKADYTAYNSSIPGVASTNLVSAGVAFSF